MPTTETPFVPVGASISPESVDAVFRTPTCQSKQAKLAGKITDRRLGKHVDLERVLMRKAVDVLIAFDQHARERFTAYK